MPDAAAFQQSFGALLGHADDVPDVALRRALAVHHNTSVKAALDALCANYPVLQRLVGEEAFAACALDYVASRPPDDPRLCLYGAGFAAHVAAWPAYSELPYLAEVGALERLVVEALFASDAQCLDPSLLAGGLDLDMPLRLHPATRIACYDCPAASLWLAHLENNEPALDDIDWSPEIALVTRGTSGVEVQVIDVGTRDFLGARTLGAAASAAHDRGGDVAAIFSALLTAGAFSI